ncbi:MAG: chemotaxis protein CheW [Gammaproteobacteria bacterium]
MSTENRELYCILLPIGNGKLLLPRSIVEEVRGLAEPQPVPGTPPWLMGKVRWRGSDIPLVAIEPFLGSSIPPTSRRSRMIVLHTPEGTLEPAAMAVLAQGFPYILRVTPELLENSEVPESEELLARINLGLETPVVPDLPALAEQAARLLAA